MMKKRDELLQIIYSALSMGVAEGLDWPPSGYAMDAAEVVWGRIGLHREADVCEALDARPDDNGVQAVMVLVRDAVTAGAAAGHQADRKLPLVQVVDPCWDRLRPSYEARLA